MGIPSDRRFLRAARRQLRHLFPELPSQDALHKRSTRLTEAIEWLCGVIAAQSPGFNDDLVLLDSTPVECGRSLETTRRSDLAEVCGYGYCKSHSRWFWGMRPHLVCALDGTPEAATLVAADRPEREIALPLLARCLHGGENRRLRQKATPGASAPTPSASSAPRSSDQLARTPDTGVHRAPTRQLIESVVVTCKDLLSLERHGARSAHNLRGRSQPGCSPSPPASASITNSDSQAAPSPTTPPNPVASII
jgi:hypothetical protein